MALKNFPIKILVASLSCTVSVLVGLSLPAVAFDFQLQGTLGAYTVQAGFDPGFTSFKGTISTPGNEPISTYTGTFNINTNNGQIPTFIINYYNAKGDMIYHQGIGDYESREFGSESLNANGRNLNFGNQLTDLSLTFSPAPANPAGLSFSSGDFGFSAILVGQGTQGYSTPVTSATIIPVPVPEPSPIKGILFVTVLAYWLSWKKPQPAKMLNVVQHDELRII